MRGPWSGSSSGGHSRFGTKSGARGDIQLASYLLHRRFARVGQLLFYRHHIYATRAHPQMRFIFFAMSITRPRRTSVVVRELNAHSTCRIKSVHTVARSPISVSARPVVWTA